MKKSNISITMESEKLNALTFYAKKREVKLADELEDTVQKLYEKYVPQSTREYIEDKLEREAKSQAHKRSENRRLTVGSTQSSTR